MGKVLALIQTTDIGGDISITVSGEDLLSQELTIQSNNPMN